jgi:hypothetical protein
VIPDPGHRRFAATGAHRAPVLLLALLIPSVGAPIEAPADAARRPPVPAVTDTAPPPASPPLDPAVLPAPGKPATAPAPSSGAAPTTGVLALRQLAAESTLVVEGVVARTESLDEDRLRVYRLGVDRTLKGAAGGAEVAVVELRSTASRPGLLADGVRAIVLLRPAPSLSYLNQHLPAGTHFALTGGRDGVLALSGDADRQAVDRALAEAMRIATLTDAAESAATRRTLAFGELASGHPRLAADALVELRGLGGVTSLAPDELAALGRTLGSREVAGPVRAGLARLAGERPWKEALPALRSAVADGPEVLHALLTARAQLGEPATKAELESYLRAKDPAIRTAAIRALATLPDAGIGDLGRFATQDGDVDVRVAAIEALGAAGRPEAVPTLSKTFAEPSRALKQASARALLAIGGPAASDALTGLALRGQDPDTRKYAALLLVVSTGRDSAAVKKLMDANPSGEVRKVVEHGLEFPHSHQHDDE